MKFIKKILSTINFLFETFFVDENCNNSFKNGVGKERYYHKFFDDLKHPVGKI